VSSDFCKKKVKKFLELEKYGWAEIKKAGQS
jgi:hypothetical protein